MARVLRRLEALLAVAMTACSATKPASPVPPTPYFPLPNAHSHNDYAQRHPLQDALDLGFCSIEADVFLVGGELLVGHTREECRGDRTVDSLYLRPLIARARAGQGVIYPGFTQPITLLVDVKAEGAAAYRALHERLTAAPDVFTELDRGVLFPRAVTVIVSGDTPRQLIAEQIRRFAFVDGRISDLQSPVEASAPTALVPLVSVPWSGTFKWDGLGEIPSEDRDRMAELVAAAHARGYRIRFWGVPERDEAWRTLRGMGVDLINADDLQRAARILSEPDAVRAVNSCSYHETLARTRGHLL